MINNKIRIKVNVATNKMIYISIVAINAKLLRYRKHL